MTRRYKLAAFLLSTISFLFVFGPVIAFAAIGFYTATTFGQCALLSCLTVGTILSIVCMINKYTPRSRLFIFLLGFYAALQHFLPCILIIGICTILDEFIVCPLKKHYHNLYTINREIDKRGI